MQERVNEIIDFLIQEISRQADPLGLNLDVISERLLDKGYTEPEIHKAVEWVIMNLGAKELSRGDKDPSAQTPSMRVLISEELNFFSPESYGYLIHLQSLGILSPLMVEQVIERCFVMGLGRVELDDLKVVVSQALLGKDLGKHNTDAIYHPGNDRLN